VVSREFSKESHLGPLCSLLTLLLTCTHSAASGSIVESEDPYNPQHIENLPTEIRSVILQKCNIPTTLSHFASYYENSGRLGILGTCTAINEAPFATPPVARIRSCCSLRGVTGPWEATSSDRTLSGS